MEHTIPPPKCCLVIIITLPTLIRCVYILIFRQQSMSLEKVQVRIREYLTPQKLHTLQYTCITMSSQYYIFLCHVILVLHVFYAV